MIFVGVNGAEAHQAVHTQDEEGRRLEPVDYPRGSKGSPGSTSCRHPRGGTRRGGQSRQSDPASVAVAAERIRVGPWSARQRGRNSIIPNRLPARPATGGYSGPIDTTPTGNPLATSREISRPPAGRT